MKTSQAMYLTKKELRIFEDIYQSMKAYPGFRMENIFYWKTREYFGVHTQCANVLFKLLGWKGEKLNIAIHEIGHATVNTAVHSQFGEAVIFPSDEGGYNGHVLPVNYIPHGDYEPSETAPKLTKLGSYSEVLIKSAGFVAEHVFTDDHSRSYHEKLLTFFQTRYMDDRDSVDPLHYWNFFIGWCQRIIKNNERLFQEMVEDILRNGSLSANARDKLHLNVKKEEASQFF